MNNLAFLQEQFDMIANWREPLRNFGGQLVEFVLVTLLLLLLVLILLWLSQCLVYKLAPKMIREFYQEIITPLIPLIRRNALLVIITFTIGYLDNIPGVYDLLEFVVYLALTFTGAWLLSRLVRQILRIYGIAIIQTISKEVNDFILVAETVANTLIGFLAALFFANSQDVQLLSLLTGLGIGALAIGLAAREVLSQLIGTIVLYLDRPYVPGEYLRANFNPAAEDIYGRVESVGIRSTKIRLAATNTLLIIPNSIMAKMDVENISRGTKVMALLYLDFTKTLSESERALVNQVLEESLNDLFGIDPGSVRISLFEHKDRLTTRARVSFFLLSSSASSLDLRKRLVNMANETIDKRLTENQLEFSMEEPILYVDSPVPR